MQDFNNSEKDSVDFLKLSDLCLDICDDKVVKLGEWTDRDIELFVSQFKEADLDPQIDMDKLDPKPYPRSYFATKFPGFDDTVIDALYEMENKKLEDMRMSPLRVLRGEVGTLEISNPNKVYNATEKEDNQAQEETKGKEDCSAEAEATADSDCTDRSRWFKTAEEEEEDDET